MLSSQPYAVACRVVWRRSTGTQPCASDGDAADTPRQSGKHRARPSSRVPKKQNSDTTELCPHQLPLKVVHGTEFWPIRARIFPPAFSAASFAAWLLFCVNRPVSAVAVRSHVERASTTDSCAPGIGRRIGHRSLGTFQRTATSGQGGEHSDRIDHQRR